MDYFLHIIYGILLSYLAMLSPGMLNMTALKVRIDYGEKQSEKFALGASVTILIQVGVALFFTDYFTKNPAIIKILEKAGVFVFFALALFFYYLSQKKIDPKAKSGKGNYFIKGFVMSAINMLAIPFYLASSVFLASKGYITIKQPYIVLYILGVFIGSLLLFKTYTYFAETISKKVSFIAKNINLILCGIFIILGFITIIRLFE